jgi:2-polyprenyl-3-methyl-5-hydroxy-6-metoxy-1,4-benzoquinol methylase
MATWPLPSTDDFSLCYPPEYAPHNVRDGSDRTESARSSGGRFFALLAGWARAVVGTRTYWIPDLPPRARALEVGCGTGGLLHRLADRGWECVGIEPAVEAARRAAESSRAAVICSTLDAAVLPAASFDAVFALHVLEHLEQPRAALAKIATLLKPNGYLIVSVPNAGSWQMAAFKSCWIACDVPRHLWHLAPAHLVRLLMSSGFAVERVLAQRHSTVDLVASLGVLLRARGRAPRLAACLIAAHTTPPALLRALTLPIEWAHEATGHATRVLAVARKAG